MRPRTPLLLSAVLTALLLPWAPTGQAAAKSLPLDIASFRDSQCIVPDYVLYYSCAVEGPRSFMASTLPQTDQVTINGVLFNWPNVGTTPAPGTMDTVMANGRVIPVPAGVKGYKSLTALLEMKTGRTKLSPIDFTITYTDGSKQKLTATACDMAYKNAGVLPKARAQYYSGAITLAGIAAGEGCVDQAVMPINSKKAVKSITLPTTGDMIQALSFSMLTSLPKKAPVFA